MEGTTHRFNVEVSADLRKRINDNIQWGMRNRIVTNLLEAALAEIESSRSNELLVAILDGDFEIRSTKTVRNSDTT